jgi:general secretion pathway protein A
MYLDFYHLNREPFRITPDPEFLYLSPSHKEALAAIAYGVEQRKGIIAVTGEVGTGKTTILRYYLGKADPERLKAAYLFNPAVSFPVLLQTIFRELGIPIESGEANGMVDRFHNYLIEEYKKDNTVVLFIDEAQNMPVATLENLRMLSNLEAPKTSFSRSSCAVKRSWNPFSTGTSCAN